jgi:hypothetical protein
MQARTPTSPLDRGFADLRSALRNDRSAAQAGQLRTRGRATIFSGMTKLLDQALDAARALPPEAQDDIARVVLRLAGTDDPPVALSAAERDAIARSKAAAARGEFATDDEVRSLWDRHGL